MVVGTNLWKYWETIQKWYRAYFIIIKQKINLKIIVSVNVNEKRSVNAHRSGHESASLNKKYTLEIVELVPTSEFDSKM